VDVTANIAPALEYAGMVTSALFSDYNKDGFADLIVVGAWMPIMVFENKNGKRLEPINATGLAESYGWWNRIEGADMDNDGDMDYVAGNWGENSFFKASADKPVWLYANDFDGNGTTDPVVFRNVNEQTVPFVNRDLFCSQMPAFNNQYYTFEKYANATLDNMFNEKLKNSSLVLKATEMRSSYVENLGDGQFKVSPLPNVAQLAPVYGIQFLDANGDGNLDIILVGNTTSNHFECGPTFGIKGLVLLGNGKGQWQPITAAQSGFYAPGEAKSLVIIGNTASKHKILIVGNNNNKPQLFEVRQSSH
jgi:enediyne biosynthesis protein E4